MAQGGPAPGPGGLPGPSGAPGHSAQRDFQAKHWPIEPLPLAIPTSTIDTNCRPELCPTTVREVGETPAGILRPVCCSTTLGRLDLLPPSEGPWEARPTLALVA